MSKPINKVIKTMNNQEIAKIFYEITDYLETEKADFRSNAYRKAALSMEELEEDVSDIYKKGGVKELEKISGIGRNIASKIEEYLKTGKVMTLQRLKKALPVKLEEMIGVEGMGPRKIKILYQKLGIKNLKDLEIAAKKHKIAPLFGFGDKTEKNILEGIEFQKRNKGRFFLGEILPRVKKILNELEKLKEVNQISVAGSVRRMKETIGDVDILTTTKDPKKVADFFISLPDIVKVWGNGSTKCSVRMKPFASARAFDVDLRIVRKASYGSALQYLTGSKEHNIATRRIAMSKGLKLNEYGVFKGKKIVAGQNEKEIYRILGLPFIEPELRENQGEIEAGLNGKLPKIINNKDIKGDLHCHSHTDGIENIAKEAIGMGYEYIGISDHTKFLRIEHGLDERQLAFQRKKIEKINKKFKNFKILQGAETNILNDGSIDIKDAALKKLDYVIAGVHSSMKMPKEKMTERIIRAMKNPYIKILSHPTGRVLGMREEYDIDFSKILRAAKEYNVALEINSFPVRLDLNDKNIRQAKELGVKMVINTDAHRKHQLNFIEFGVGQARRGWAEKKDVINTYSLEKLLNFFK